MDRASPRGFRPAHLSDEVAAYMRDLVLSGQVRAGAPLNIDALARELSVSTAPVREALLALRGEGFVTFEPRRGFKAAAHTRQDIADIYWMQSEIAGELAARAASHADDELLRDLTQLQARIRSALDAAADDEVEELNFALHQRINHRAGGAKLLWMLGLVVRYAPRRFYGSIPGWSTASVNDHEAVIDALRDRDPEAARAAMRLHILNAAELLMDNLERLAKWKTPARGDGSDDAHRGPAARP